MLGLQQRFAVGVPDFREAYIRRSARRYAATDRDEWSRAAPRRQRTRLHTVGGKWQRAVLGWNFSSWSDLILTGNNAYGQLGYNNTKTVQTPRRFVRLRRFDSAYTYKSQVHYTDDHLVPGQIAGGDDFTCVFLPNGTATNNTRCWGMSPSITSPSHTFAQVEVCSRVAAADF